MPQLALHALGTSREDIRGLMGDMAEMGKLHLALFAQEARVEKARIKRKALLLAMAGIAATAALFFTIAAVIALSWDTPYRWYAVIGAPVLLWVAAIASVLTVSNSAEMAQPFAKSTEEIRKDGKWLLSFL